MKWKICDDTLLLSIEFNKEELLNYKCSSKTFEFLNSSNISLSEITNITYQFNVTTFDQEDDGLIPLKITLNLRIEYTTPDFVKTQDLSAVSGDFIFTNTPTTPELILTPIQLLIWISQDNKVMLSTNYFLENITPF